MGWAPLCLQGLSSGGGCAHREQAAGQQGAAGAPLPGLRAAATAVLLGRDLLVMTLAPSAFKMQLWGQSLAPPKATIPLSGCSIA